MQNKHIWLLQLKTHVGILFNAGSLVGTTIVTSLLGFVYWWVAAQFCPPDVVGLASALISAMTLLATISMLGLGTLLTGELPRQPGHEWSLIHAALLIVGGLGLGSGMIFALSAPLFTSAFNTLHLNAFNLILFALGVSLTTVTLVLDQAYIGIMRGDLQFWRNALFAAIKLGALGIISYVLTAKTGILIYGTWSVGNLVSLVILFFGRKPRPVNQKPGEPGKSLQHPGRSPASVCPDCGAQPPQQAYFCPACGYPLTPTLVLANVRSPFSLSESTQGHIPVVRVQKGKPDNLTPRKMVRQLGKAALQHHLLNLILLVPPLVLPLLVTIQLSARDNAWFYVSFMLANLVFSLTYALTTALYAVSAARPSLLAHNMRLTLGLALLTGLGATLILQPGAGLLLGIFGHAYAAEAAWCLRLLSLAVFPLIIISHYVALCRIQQRMFSILLPVLCGALIEIGGAAVGAKLAGLVGVSLGWLVGLLLEALYMAPAVYREAFPEHTRHKEVSPRPS